jgi:hypothetical protein
LSRGLGSRLLSNGLQSVLFTIIWKLLVQYFNRREVLNDVKERKRDIQRELQQNKKLQSSSSSSSSRGGPSHGGFQKSSNVVSYYDSQDALLKRPRSSCNLKASPRSASPRNTLAADHETLDGRVREGGQTEISEHYKFV